MRVTFEHRQERKNFFVDAIVEFTEEEKEIIKQRNLDVPLKTDPAYPPMNETALGLRATALSLLSRIFVVIGVVFIFVSMFRGGGDVLPFVFWGIAFYLFLNRRIAERRSEAARQPQFISLKELVRNPKFTVYAGNPAFAQSIEEEIRNQLTALKQVIMKSTGVGGRQTYDI